MVVGNEPDAKGLLHAQEGVYTGSYPKELNIANTSVEWSGVRWTQIMWPLPEDAGERRTLLAHEMFHRIQPELKLMREQTGNAHLDTPEGRYWLQLEWRALAQALVAKSPAEQKQRAQDALLFRAERYHLFAHAEAEEAALEFVEGLAEYTGVRIGNTAPEEQLKAALRDLDRQQKVSSYVRSFAYATGPAYGLLLDRWAAGWTKQVKAGSSTAELLRQAVKFTAPADVASAAKKQAALYGGAALWQAEEVREKERQARLATYRAEFLERPVLVLGFSHMQIQFDPRNLQPLEGHGTVYPTMRVVDDWGVLEVREGALLNTNWSAVTVSAPESNTGEIVKGKGWELQLKKGWTIIPEKGTKNFVLKKTE